MIADKMTLAKSLVTRSGPMKVAHNTNARLACPGVDPPIK